MTQRGSLSLQSVGLLAAAVAAVVGGWVYVESRGRGPIGRVMAAYLQKQTDCWNPDKPCDWEVGYPEGRLDLGPEAPDGFLTLVSPESRPSSREAPEPEPSATGPVGMWHRPKWDGIQARAQELAGLVVELVGRDGLAVLGAGAGGLFGFLILLLLLGGGLVTGGGSTVVLGMVGFLASLISGLLYGRGLLGHGVGGAIAFALGLLTWLGVVLGLDRVGRVVPGLSASTSGVRGSGAVPWWVGLARAAAHGWFWYDRNVNGPIRRVLGEGQGAVMDRREAYQEGRRQAAERLAQQRVDSYWAQEDPWGHMMYRAQQHYQEARVNIQQVVHIPTDNPLGEPFNADAAMMNARGPVNTQFLQRLRLDPGHEANYDPYYLEALKTAHDLDYRRALRVVREGPLGELAEIFGDERFWELIREQRPTLNE